MKRVKAFLAIGLISSMLLAGCQRNGEPLPDSSISVSDKSSSETSSAGVSKEISKKEKAAEEIAIEEITEEEIPAKEDLKMAGANERMTKELSSEAEEAKDVDRENNSNSRSDLISGLRITHKDNNYYGESYRKLIISH